jgi:hypothetical protein
MSSAGTGGAFEVAVEPRNDRYDPDDDGWRDQVNTLYAAVAPGGRAAMAGRYRALLIGNSTYPADGRVLDFQTAKPGQDTVTLAPGESRSVYLGLSDCAVQVSAG